MALALGLAAPALADGFDFERGTLDDALAVARSHGSMVLAEVDGAWCKPCAARRTEIDDTGDGAQSTPALVAWRIDIDAPDEPGEMARLAKRLNILVTPTTLLLRPDGSELGRIEGYHDKAAFLAELSAIRSGEDSLAWLSERLAASREHTERTRLNLELSHLRLARGDPGALSVIERTITEDPGPKGSAAQEALYFLASYLSRQRHDDGAAMHVWRELAMRFPAGEYATTAAWWYAGSLHRKHKDALAVTFLEGRARRARSAQALDVLVSFAEKSGAGRQAGVRLLHEIENRPHPDLEDTLLASLGARLDKVGARTPSPARDVEEGAAR